MKNFSSIQEVTGLGGPAAVNLDTAVLYIDRREFDKLSDTAKKFVIAHELGHLNASEDSEQAADKWAFWRRLELGDDKIDVLKAFYKSLPFSTHEQIERGEKMLQNVFATAAYEGNEAATMLLQNAHIPEYKHGNIRGFVLAICSIVSAAVGIEEAIRKGIKANKEQKKAAAAEAEVAQEILREEQRIAATFDAEQQMLKKLAEEQQLAEEAQKKKQTGTIIKVAVVIIILVVGFLIYKKYGK